MRYFNYKDEYGTVETIDEISSNDFPNLKEYKKECSRLLSEYNMCHSSRVYLSSRATKRWRER